MNEWNETQAKKKKAKKTTVSQIAEVEHGQPEENDDDGSDLDAKPKAKKLCAKI